MRTDKSRVALDLAGFDDYLRVFEPPEHGYAVKVQMPAGKSATVESYRKCRDREEVAAVVQLLSQLAGKIHVV